MQIDPHLSLGNIITMGLLVFGAGGAWYSVRQGLRDLKQSQAESSKSVQHRLDTMAGEIASIREKYISKELDAAREELFDAKIQRLADKVLAIEGSRQREEHDEAREANRRKRRT